LGQRIFIVAGEASADLHASLLVKKLKEKDPTLEFFGVGGAHLRGQGVDLVASAETLNVVGGTDWWDKLWNVLGVLKRVKREVGIRKPSLAILLDLPDFNLNLARFLHKSDIPVTYYISPQVWAWRAYRVNQIRRWVTKMLVVFPFEESFYRQRGVEAIFVGHPLLEQIPFGKAHRLHSEVKARPRIAVLPGSRKSELHFHKGVLTELMGLLRARYPEAEIQVPIASTLSKEAIEAAFPDGGFQAVSGDSRDVLRWADVAAVASGTATLETALVGTPFCLFYKTSRSTSWFIRNLVQYKRYFGMPNLLCGKEVAREFLFEKASGASLFAECVQLIDDESYRSKVASDLHLCRGFLGEERSASQFAAAEIFELLRNPRKSENLCSLSGAILPG
jgi:lipid-A-disaccharide synthase